MHTCMCGFQRGKEGRGREEGGKAGKLAGRSAGRQTGRQTEAEARREGRNKQSSMEIKTVACKLKGCTYTYATTPLT